MRGKSSPKTLNLYTLILLHSERGNFKLFGLIYKLYFRKFELFGARLLKKRVKVLIIGTGVGAETRFRRVGGSRSSGV